MNACIEASQKRQKVCNEAIRAVIATRPDGSVPVHMTSTAPSSLSLFFFFSLSFFFTDGGALLKRTAHFLSVLL